MSALSDFVSSNKSKLAASVIGGIALAAVAGSLPGMSGEALARSSHFSYHSSHHSSFPSFHLFGRTSDSDHHAGVASSETTHTETHASESAPSDSGWSLYRMMRIFRSHDSEQTISEAQAASDEAKAAAEKTEDDTENLQEAIGDKRARLQNAIKELENLSDAVDKARDLDAADRDETISAAVGVYNDAVSGTEFNNATSKPEATEISASESDIAFDVKAFNAQWEAARSSTDMLQKLHPMQGQ